VDEDMKKTCSKKLKASSYVVIRDTREKPGHGWTFDKSATCGGTKVSTLKTGDYTLVGYEDILCVERKGCVREFAMNLLQKRFEAELVRMTKFAVAVVVLEFDFEDIIRWPEGSGIPKYKWRKLKVRSSLLLKKFWDLKIAYPNIQFMFAGYHGKEAVSSLFKRVNEMRLKGASSERN
jgi:hypothetical protein